MFSNSQKSLPRNSQNFGVIIPKQNIHYLRFKIVVDCKSDEEIKILGRRGKEREKIPVIYKSIDLQCRSWSVNRAALLFWL